MIQRWTSGTSFFDYSESRTSETSDGLEEENERIEARQLETKPERSKRNFLEFFLCFEETHVDDFQDDLASTLRKSYGSKNSE